LDPAVVLREFEQAQGIEIDADAMSHLQREIASLLDRERRLVRLYTFGEIDEQVVRDEGANLRRQRLLLEQRLKSLQQRAAPAGIRMDPEMLARTCSAVATWLDRAGAAERVQVLEALQVAIVATKDAATLTGVLPLEPPEFAGTELSCRCR
jgi:hypothetical protein